MKMEGLHSVMRSIRGETKARRDHLSVFREFLNYLERPVRQGHTPASGATYEGEPRRDMPPNPLLDL